MPSSFRTCRRGRKGVRARGGCPCRCSRPRGQLTQQLLPLGWLQGAAGARCVLGAQRMPRTHLLPPRGCIVQQRAPGLLVLAHEHLHVKLQGLGSLEALNGCPVEGLAPQLHQSLLLLEAHALPQQLPPPDSVAAAPKRAGGGEGVGASREASAHGM